MADYFQRLVPNLPQVERIYEAFVQVEGELVTLVTTSPDPAVRRVAANQARLVRRAYQHFQEDLIRLAQRCAEVANEEVMRLYQDSRTPRGDTGNPPHLSEALPTSEVIPTPIPAGVVGIARLEELEKFDYWKAQEFGLDAGFVGREVKGWFFGAGFTGPSAPNPAQSQQHPLFRPSSNGLTMHIQNPIEPGHFLTDTVKTVEALWLKLMNECVTDVTRDLDAVLGQARPVGYREGVLRRGARRR
jgi:hypothetical protein